jgi:hypothetical protein
MYRGLGVVVYGRKELRCSGQHALPVAGSTKASVGPGQLEPGDIFPGSVVAGHHEADFLKAEEESAELFRIVARLAWIDCEVMVGEEAIFYEGSKARSTQAGREFADSTYSLLRYDRQDDPLAWVIDVESIPGEGKCKPKVPL